MNVLSLLAKHIAHAEMPSGDKKSKNSFYSLLGIKSELSRPMRIDQIMN